MKSNVPKNPQNLQEIEHIEVIKKSNTEEIKIEEPIVSTQEGFIKKDKLARTPQTTNFNN